MRNLLNRMAAGVLLGVVALARPMAPRAQGTTERIPLTVHEAGGIRRSAFPAMIRVPFGRGLYRDAPPLRLTLNGADVPSQTTITGTWPDGSVQWLDVDFTTSPGPDETLTYQIEYGAGVTPAPPPRGLTVAELGEAIQIGNVRISRRASPLVASVAYRDEAIGPGDNGFIATDTGGRTYALAAASDLACEIVKRGPLMVSLRYTGSLAVGATTLPFTIGVEMPSSKSWVRLTADIPDPQRTLAGVALASPLSLGPTPWVWDFGTGRYTYGQLRNATDRVRFEKIGTTNSWSVTTVVNGRSQVTETGTWTTAPFAGWAHLQGAKEVVAVVMEGARDYQGVSMEFGADGQSRFALTPPNGSSRHRLGVYEHFVSVPVQIGAATGPSAILSPLEIRIPPEVLRRAGIALSIRRA